MAEHNALPTNTLLAFSCGNCSSSVQDLIEELGILKAETAEDYLDASDQAMIGIHAQETGRVYRRLSVVIQKALAVSYAPIRRATEHIERWHIKPCTPTWPDDIRNSSPMRARRDSEFFKCKCFLMRQYTDLGHPVASTVYRCCPRIVHWSTS